MGNKQRTFASLSCLGSFDALLHDDVCLSVAPVSCRGRRPLIPGTTSERKQESKERGRIGTASFDGRSWHLANEIRRKRDGWVAVLESPRPSHCSVCSAPVIQKMKLSTR